MYIDEIKQANARAGYYFFAPATMRFFRSRVSSTIYQGVGGIYFITSEQFVDSNGVRASRRFTVRQFNPITGMIKSVGDFNKLTYSMAQKTAKNLAKGLSDQ